ncbi:hypothetical protein [Streptomyces netropsis]|uniref:Uncharacterized protein n=1 Tax=Streptomyces netropsis TaxID=55404 RepID=A0A7W7LAW4_STRNE|nr:hypothetical protein [Streptomyces netropsis]MBB4886797.1 hypothetical protein [Streptomyces netropsis]GGR23191.1 hypothetical protein GCM10010219_29890 [Streptomyces netropsis]
MDLLDWHRGSLSTRRLSVLVKHMPRDSAVNRDLHGEAVEWDSSTHLLAAAVDHLAVANWMTTTLNSGEDSEPPDYPEAVPRPGFPDFEPEPAPADSIPSSPDTAPTPDQLRNFFS